MDPLTFVCFKWQSVGYRSKFTGEHVDVLRRMVRRHYRRPHRFVCVTDDASDITEPDVECFELWDDLAHVPNPSGRGNPSCYRRLKLFARNAGVWLGPRVVVMDLDTVIVGDLSPLFVDDVTFKAWRAPGGWNPYNGSLWQLQTGSLPEVWEQFDPKVSPRTARSRGFNGSDQGWFACALGVNRPVWTQADGVYSYRYDLNGRPLPANARVVFFHGKEDPWDPGPQRQPWVREAWR